MIFVFSFWRQESSYCLAPWQTSVKEWSALCPLSLEPQSHHEGSYDLMTPLTSNFPSNSHLLVSRCFNLRFYLVGVVVRGRQAFSPKQLCSVGGKGESLFHLPRNEIPVYNLLKDIRQWLLDSFVLTLGGCYYEQSFVAISDNALKYFYSCSEMYSSWYYILGVVTVSLYLPKGKVSLKQVIINGELFTMNSKLCQLFEISNETTCGAWPCL